MCGPAQTADRKAGEQIDRYGRTGRQADIRAQADRQILAERQAGQGRRARTHAHQARPAPPSPPLPCRRRTSSAAAHPGASVPRLQVVHEFQETSSFYQGSAKDLLAAVTSLNAPVAPLQTGVSD